MAHPNTLLVDAKAVVFDVYGTLAHIADCRRPYSRLTRLIRRESQRHPEDEIRLMTHDVEFTEAARLLGATVSEVILADLERDLAAELMSVTLFADAAPCLIRLRNAGIKLALCSNLAKPYAAPIKKLLPFELDAYAWSFEVGLVKPQPRIYQKVCDALECNPSEVVMVGDTVEADFTGPKSVGMRAIHLARHGSSPADRSIRSLAELSA